MDTQVYINDRVRTKRRIQRKEDFSVKSVITKESLRWIVSAALIASFVVLSMNFAKYTLNLYCVLFIAIIALFHKEFSLKLFGKNLASGIKFWLVGAITFALMFLVSKLNFFLTYTVFSPKYLDNISYTIKENMFSYIVLALTFIVLEPLAESLMLRKALLRVDSNIAKVLCVFVSMFVVGIVHAYGVLGIVEAGLLTLPLTLCYLLTKNIYVTIAAQIAFAMYTYLPDVVYYVARFAMR